MLQELDYVLDHDDDIWIVNYFCQDGPYGYVVYKCSEYGDRHNHMNGYNYFKCRERNVRPIPEAKRIFHPRDFFQEHHMGLDGLWKRFSDQMIISGINPNNIGIFGSCMVGFDIIKDVDFVLYGNECLNIYYKNKDKIKEGCGCSYISKEHIDYQVKKYGNEYHEKCDLRGVIERNWSGIQSGDGIGILSTPRFIPDNRVIVPQPADVVKVIECTVISGITSSFVPRYCDVLYDGKRYRLITPYWMFQSFAKDGDRLRIRCDVNEKEKLLLLVSKEHWLQYID